MSLTVSRQNLHQSMDVKACEVEVKATVGEYKRKKKLLPLCMDFFHHF